MQETWVRSLGQEDSMEKGMDTHYSILAWEIPWTKDPARLQSMALQRVRRSCVTIIFKLMHMDIKTPHILQQVTIILFLFSPLLSFYASSFMTYIVFLTFCNIFFATKSI